MDKKKRKIFGVISADAADIEQREILSGIIENAHRQNIDIIVISNIYNPIETSAVLQTENRIYERIASPLFDGFILISESIINADLQTKILGELRKRQDVPIIVLGTPQPRFELPNSRVINTSDENDIEDITDHLIDVHGYSEIDILSGCEHIEASKKRIEGYRRSLEKHGIPFDEKRVHFGDFWTTSGHEYAKKYISGELSYPHALICCNDYMAYGFLDEFMEQRIPITEKMAVIGYEYVRERHAHMPLLSTYQRNRKALGTAAVDALTGADMQGFVPEHGRIICGETCGCHGRFDDLCHEMTSIQTKEMYEFLNLFSQLEHRLTECRNISEFVERCWDFQFMVRNVGRLYLCLYENWYDNNPESENMVRYNLRYYEEPVIFHKDNFSDFISGEPAPYYLCPLFFADRELGYIVLSYDGADTFDHIFRNWLKSIANGLELLRMKNDIRYLAACQNLSEQHDSLTGMLNENGINKAYISADKSDLCMVSLRIFLFDTDFSAVQTNEKVYAILDAAEAIQQFCGEKGICSRINQDTFICLVKNNDENFCSDLLRAIMYNHSAYMAKYGMDSFVCAAIKCGDKTITDAMAECERLMQNEIAVISARRREKNYPAMSSLRNAIYTDPNSTFDTDKLREGFAGSPGYLRIIYKKIFDVSFHNDCISARIAKAKYLLTVTNDTIRAIAFQCGYDDYKYFMRQFAQATGVTASEFKDRL